jgi:hypothetical protein
VRNRAVLKSVAAARACGAGPTPTPSRSQGVLEVGVSIALPVNAWRGYLKPRDTVEVEGLCAAIVGQLLSVPINALTGEVVPRTKMFGYPAHQDFGPPTDPDGLLKTRGTDAPYWLT